ncbi:MAG: laccase domain-containing protein, partial [Solirubrobacteraceae bacterium]
MSASAHGGLAGEIFDLPGGARALFTGRAHGNLSSVGGEGAEAGLKARESLRAAIGVQRLARGYQVHGTVICAVVPGGDGTVLRGVLPGGPLEAIPRDGERQPDVEADGHAVAVKGVGAMVMAADCVPVVLGAE